MPEHVVIEQNGSGNNPALAIEQRAVSRIKAKILHVLSIYPKLNASMLQVGIGPSIAPDIWRPILQMLIREGFVSHSEVETTGPTGRSQTAGILQLTDVGLSITAQGNTNNAEKVNGEAGTPSVASPETLTTESHRA